MHGEDARFLIIQSCVPETSLRARGRPTLIRIETPHVRNIPACAGKAIEAEGFEPLSSKHPRVRGEGLRVELADGTLGGNIPACAGKARLPAFPPAQRRKLPRVRGEGAIACISAGTDTETSPRARGRLLGIPQAQILWGNIPACAGKARSRDTTGRRCWKHPHVRGEGFFFFVTGYQLAETSPRARGRPASGRPGLPHRRNIPACAGKAILERTGRIDAGKHPRVRGEGIVAFAMMGFGMETSPRARGRPSSPRRAPH